MSIHANPVRAAMLAALVLAVATAATPQRARGDTVPGSFQRVQALADLVPGDYVVTGSKANSDDQYAMLHELGGSSTTYLLRHGDEPLTVAADAIADPDDSIVWTLEESELGWTLRNGDDYVAYKGSANSATFTNAAVSNAQWTVTESGTEGLFAVANAAKPERVLQYYTTSGSERFACYTNFSRTQPLAFWRKTASGGLVPHAIAISPAIENGTLATDPSGSATAGEQVEVTGIPADGWHLAEVTVTGDSSALSWTYPTSGEPIGFPMPDEDVTLTARFEQDEGPGPGTGGIRIEGDATGTVDREVTFTVIPEQEGASVYIQGFEPPADSTLTMDALTLDFPLVAFVPDAPGDYRFLFATDDATAEWTVTVTAGDDPGPGGDAIRFDGDSEGAVGEEAAFTATAASEDARLYLTDFIPPQGSSLTMDTIGIDLPDVTFVPDVPGPYVFVFVAASPTAQASGEWTVTVLPAPPRITSIDVRSGTVTLRYEGDAASVQGTADLGDYNSWCLYSYLADYGMGAHPRYYGFTVRPVRRPPPAHDGVQLWKNGPYWAETNIGADNPEDSGLYFWWGDTIGYRRENDAWVASDGSLTNYDFTMGNTLTYGMDNATLQSEGWITEEGVLAPEHDAAQTHWGGDWWMPTDVELQALLDNCDWTWPTTVNGVYGYLVRGRGDYASNSIFLPAAGHGYRTSLEDAGWGEAVATTTRGVSTPIWPTTAWVPTHVTTASPSAPSAASHPPMPGCNSGRAVRNGRRRTSERTRRQPPAAPTSSRARLV